MLNVGCLASHGGSNLQAILDACRDGRLAAEVSVVISNNGSARALERAREAGVAALHLSRAVVGSEEAVDEAIARALLERGVEIVALAGYMKKIGPAVLSAYAGRILNIHPALLPRFGGKGMFGMHVHEAVIAAGEQQSGVTVHVVDERYDHGPILAQERIEVLPDDTPETLQKRVLTLEHRLYPEVLQRIASGEIRLQRLGAARGGGLF